MKYVLIGIILLEALLTSMLPYTKGWFFSSLEARSGIYLMLVYLFINNFTLDLIQSFKTYCTTRYSLNKRERHSRELVLVNNKDVDNVAQRVQEDVKLMYQNRYIVYVEYWISGIILATIIVSNFNYYWLILGALTYAIISIGIAYLFNPRMCKAEKLVQSSEANYRTNYNILSFLFIANRNCLYNAKVKLEYTLFTKLQNSLLLIIPYLLLLPSYLLGNIMFGELIKIATMFQLLVVNADILIAMYPTLIIAKASKERVEELSDIDIKDLRR